MALSWLSFSLLAQEYDDLYFSKKDRIADQKRVVSSEVPPLPAQSRQGVSKFANPDHGESSASSQDLAYYDNAAALATPGMPSYYAGANRYQNPYFPYRGRRGNAFYNGNAWNLGFNTAFGYPGTGFGNPYSNYYDPYNPYAFGAGPSVFNSGFNSGFGYGNSWNNPWAFGYGFNSPFGYSPYGGYNNACFAVLPRRTLVSAVSESGGGNRYRSSRFSENTVNRSRPNTVRNESPAATRTRRQYTARVRNRASRSYSRGPADRGNSGRSFINVGSSGNNSGRSNGWKPTGGSRSNRSVSPSRNVTPTRSRSVAPARRASPAPRRSSGGTRRRN